MAIQIDQVADRATVIFHPVCCAISQGLIMQLQFLYCVSVFRWIKKVPSDLLVDLPAVLTVADVCCSCLQNLRQGACRGLGVV